MKKHRVNPRPRRKPQLPPSLPPFPAADPSSPAGVVELAEAEAKRTALISKALGAATGVGDNKRVAERLVAQFNSILSGGTDISLALFMLIELRPANMLEALLVTQMIGVHEAALAFLRTSTTALSEESRNQNAFRATRFMRLFNEQLEQLQRLKGTTRQQKMIVEHVHVNAGGQAIVGVVDPVVKNTTDETP